jgi:hypothetical protein
MLLGAYTPAGIVLQVIKASKSPHPLSYYLRDRIAISPHGNILLVDCFIFIVICGTRSHNFPEILFGFIYSVFTFSGVSVSIK